jgi:hypothetical protein
LDIERVLLKLVSEGGNVQLQEVSLQKLTMNRKLFFVGEQNVVSLRPQYESLNDSLTFGGSVYSGSVKLKTIRKEKKDRQQPT